MRRRDFLMLLGAGVAACPFAARAQQAGPERLVGVLMAGDETDPAARVFLSLFRQELSALGWRDGRNMRMEVRWCGESMDRIRGFAKEMVTIKPDVILTDTTPVTAAVHVETRTIPTVFVVVSDPVGSGFVAGLPRPGGNITGFTVQDQSIAGKWLELLTQIAPGIKRSAFMFNPDTAPYTLSYYQPAFEAAARSLNVMPMMAPARNDAEIAKVISSLEQEPRGGLVGLADNFMLTHRAQIIRLAAQHNVPAVYYDLTFVKDGGLLSYGPDFGDIFRRAAPYVDRILRGANPADLPVQLPVKYEMGLNTRTAKALGLTVPPSLLATADDVIE